MRTCTNEHVVRARYQERARRRVDNHRHTDGKQVVGERLAEGRAEGHLRVARLGDRCVGDRVYNN